MLNRIVPLVLGLASAALAQTLIVTTVQDVVDPNDGVLSLREAIIAANNNVNAAGQCRGVTDIHFSLPGTNALATYGTMAVPYYKLEINYHDPEYASVMNVTPRPTTLPHVRCPINLDGYTQPDVRPRSPLIEISGEDLPVDFAATPIEVRGTDKERSPELLTLVGRLVRQLETGPTLVGCRPADPGCPLLRSASGSTIRGIMFNHAPQRGLALFGADNVTITGNHFGLDATGENAAPNGRRRDGFTGYSLWLNGASNNTVGTPKEPNYFGVARSHSIILFQFTFFSGECGATSPANASCGRMDIGSSENLIQSNYFGLNKGGTRSVGGICMLNGGDRRFPGESGCEPGGTRDSAIYTNGGPHIFVNFNVGNVPVSQNSMRRNRIGGTKPGEGNVFVASFTGVHVKGVDTEVLGNIFGLDSKGVGAGEIAPFFRTAVIIQGDATGTLLSENIIANSAIYGNLNTATIHGYAGGVNVQGQPSGPGYTDDLPPNIISRNNIGVNVHRRHPGVNLLGLPATNAGGGVTSIWMLPLRIEDNLIAYNGYLGAAAITARTAVFGGAPYPMRRLVVLGNSMYCNGAPAAGETCGLGMGIDWHASPGVPSPPSPGIGGDGPTLNDDGDLDDGPAELQNNPVLTAVRGGVAGRLSSKPNRRYRIQIFSSSLDSATCVAVTSTMQSSFESDPACANSGVSPAFLAVQGDTLLREFDIQTDSKGVADFSLQTPSNRMIAATATELSEDGQPLHTSELSQAVSTRRP